MAARINPLPSLIRASAWDAGNTNMRDAGRKVWNAEDRDAAAQTQERLIRACYSRAWDNSISKRCYIRFSMAEQAERDGTFDLKTNFKKLSTLIDDALAASGMSVMHV